MTGKVFSSSNDIYDDQAKVLFDYYRQAAERIVAEEIDLENQIEFEKAAYQQALQDIDTAHKSFIGWCIATGASIFLVVLHPLVMLIAMAIFGAIAYNKFNEEKEARTAVEQQEAHIAELYAAKQNIRRDYRVEKIGVAYVPVARRIPTGNQSFVIDYTGDQPETEFSLTLINQPDELKGVMDSIQEHMEELPTVETNEDVERIDTSDYSTSVQDVTLHDYTGAIDRQIRNARYLIEDSHDVSVTLPVVPPLSERYQFLEEYGTDDVGDYPVVPVFDDSAARAKAEEFSAMGAINQQSAADGSGDATFFVDVMRRLAQGVDLLSRSRTASVSRLTNYSSGILRNVLKASFDQYSPLLEAEEIERIRQATFNYADEMDSYKPFSLKQSSRVRYDIFADAWIADNGTRTAMPFGMHQVDIEVLMPVIGNLMQENRRERLRIYSDIQNQKTDYLNQWHRDTDDFFGRNRTEANALIQNMNEAYAEFVENYTNYQQQRATIDSMKASGNLEDSEVAEAKNQAQIVEGFQLQTSQARAKQEEFTSFMERIREDIDVCAEQFGHVEYYEASLRDAQARDTARAAASVRDLDPRRMRLAEVSPYLAQNGNVPPEPRVSEKLNDDFSINLSGQVEQEIDALFGSEVPNGHESEQGVSK